MTQPNKFGDLNGWFLSLGTGTTQTNKFEELNNRFASLETEGDKNQTSLGTSDALCSKKKIDTRRGSSHTLLEK